MEMIIELLAKFLWALCKDAVMLFIITKVKELLHGFFKPSGHQESFSFA
jgi:hypothetical protein